jgi:hypothetical protein
MSGGADLLSVRSHLSAVFSVWDQASPPASYILFIGTHTLSYLLNHMLPALYLVLTDGAPYKRSRDGLQRQCEEQKALIRQLEHRCKEMHELLQHRNKEVSAMEEALFSVWYLRVLSTPPPSPQLGRAWRSPCKDV